MRKSFRKSKVQVEELLCHFHLECSFDSLLRNRLSVTLAIVIREKECHVL